GDFGPPAGPNRRHQLGAVACDTAGFVFPANHEARDVLQEYEGDAALAAQLDEMRALQRAFAEQNAVVGDDADGKTPDMGKAADQRRAVKLLELVEFRAVDNARDDVMYVEGLSPVG